MKDLGIRRKSDLLIVRQHTSYHPWDAVRDKEYCPGPLGAVCILHHWDQFLTWMLGESAHPDRVPRVRFTAIFESMDGVVIARVVPALFVLFTWILEN
jgi:hypothetical protein